MADGSVLIAALTSCTNTSHPGSMVTAGLIARRAVELGLTVPAWVKTSLAPGSRTVPKYLDRAGLLEPLERLGFNVVAFGCTTCHGMSGPLTAQAARAVTEDGITGAAVLSGNRNFEGRIHPQVRAAYLASPGLVVAYALAGTVDRDLTREPVAVAPDGREVHLRDLWPDPTEVAAVVQAASGPELFESAYADLFQGDERWQALEAPTGELYRWPEKSSYILEPPYIDPQHGFPATDELTGARVLAVLGDSVSTDHISPVGGIAPDAEAGRYLAELGVPEEEFNSYGARRGNHHVMLRGTFGNPRLRNAMADGREGAWTRHHPTGDLLSVHEAAERYRTAATPTVVVAGREYLSLIHRLGRQGHRPARRPGGAGGGLRADPPEQPGRHGRAPAALPGRREPRGPRHRRLRGVGPQRAVRAPPARPGHGPAASPGRLDDRLRGDRRGGDGPRGGVPARGRSPSLHHGPPGPGVGAMTGAGPAAGSPPVPHRAVGRGGTGGCSA